MIGASVDTGDQNAAFREAEGLDYELVYELGLVIDIEGHGPRSARYTYLLEPDGTILRIWKVGRGDAIVEHPGEVLEAVRELAAA